MLSSQLGQTCNDVSDTKLRTSKYADSDTLDKKQKAPDKHIHGGRCDPAGESRGAMSSILGNTYFILKSNKLNIALISFKHFSKNKKKKSETLGLVL